MFLRFSAPGVGISIHYYIVQMLSGLLVIYILYYTRALGVKHNILQILKKWPTHTCRHRKLCLTQISLTNNVMQGYVGKEVFCVEIVKPGNKEGMRQL